ncbi:MAG: hypothetical protein KAJ40_04450 [Alphaproteobacteria bacterium]|nr:hypothetical protein [Alphaproteobacteria bacterium]
MIGKKLHSFPEVQKLKQKHQDIILNRIDEPSIVTYRQLLLGQIDFLIFKVTYPWDHLPGIAFLKHNNAVISRWSGAPFEFSDTHEGLVIARNQEIMDTLLGKIIAPLLQSEKIVNMQSFKS